MDAITPFIDLLSQDGQVIIISARQAHGWGVTPGSWKPFLTKSCGDVHRWRGRGIAISDSFEWDKLCQESFHL